MPRRPEWTLSDGTWCPAPRRELWLLGLYFGVIIALTDIVNVRPGIELMSAVTAFAAFYISRQLGTFLRDWWLLLIGLLFWNLSGAIAGESPFPWHLGFMMNVDHAVFFGHQPVVWLQHLLYVPGQVRPLDVLAAYSYNLHLPEPYIAAYFLWRINRLAYARFAAAVLLLLVTGFVTFVLFPAVPPWMAAKRFGLLPHVVNGFGPVLQSHPWPFHGTPIFYIFKLTGDRVAAFPSEHAAFPFLECLAFIHVSRWVSVALGIWTLWVLFVVVYLGEHWFTDVVAGWIYALVIFLLVMKFSHGGFHARVSLRRVRGGWHVPPDRQTYRRQ